MITNLQNPLIKEVASLHKRKYRLASQSYLIEGIRFVEEALRAKAAIKQILFVSSLLEQDRGGQIIAQAREQQIPLQEVAEHVLKKVADTETPQGLVAVISMPQEEMNFDQMNSLSLLVDGVQDPGNLGTILRTADAAGIKRVFLTAGTVDVFNPKTLRSTMGSIFHLSVNQIDIPGLASYVDQIGAQVVVADVNGQQPYFQVDFTPPTLLVVGSEAHGPSPEIRQLCKQLVNIPMPGNAESLNVAIATGILLFEALRQRQG